jgi:UDP-3-O-[3-hydroxymyristoyl] glucosamine N-acyltransferase
MPGYGTDFSLKGFLDTRILHDTILPVLNEPLKYAPEKDDAFVIALSDPSQKKAIAGHLRSLGAGFFNVIHPENYIAPSFVSGEGLIIAPYNSISNRVTFGDFVGIYGFCKIGHDLKIGHFCHIASHCSIDGFSTIQDETSLISYTKIQKNTTL